MIAIYCPPSPFIFKPINLLLHHVDWKKREVADSLIFHLLEPMNKEFQRNRKNSHMTDAQNHETQLRFLGNTFLENRLRNFAMKLTGYLDPVPIEIHLHPDFVFHKMFQLFIKYFSVFHKSTVSIQIRLPRQGEEVFKLNEVELHYFLSPENRKEYGEVIFKAAHNCIHAMDYWSAQNLLLSVVDIGLSQKFQAKVIDKLALAYRAESNFGQASFWSQRILEIGDVLERKRAHYGMAMMYIRNYSPSFRSLEQAEYHLNIAYKEIEKYDYDSVEKEIDMLFNRNGFALILFRRGKVEKARDIVAHGIKRLGQLNTPQALFNQSVLMYNLFQCQIVLKDFDEAEQTIQELIAIDPQFHSYYIYYYRFLKKQGKNEEALHLLNQMIANLPAHYFFHLLKGETLFDLGEKETAKIEFEKAQNLNPFDDNGKLFLTEIYAEINSYFDLINLTSSSSGLSKNPDNGESIILQKIIALLHTDSKNISYIQNLLDQAISFHPSSEELLFLNKKLKVVEV